MAQPCVLPCTNWLPEPEVACEQGYMLVSSVRCRSRVGAPAVLGVDMHLPVLCCTLDVPGGCLLDPGNLLIAQLPTYPGGHPGNQRTRWHYRAFKDNGPRCYERAGTNDGAGEDCGPIPIRQSSSTLQP